MKTILLFVDGLGIGDEDAGVNPLLRARMTNLRALLGGGIPTKESPGFSFNGAIAKPIDAVLDIEGLPQSGTGQIAIFTGANGPRLHGAHFGPYPPSSLRGVLESDNIFRRLIHRKKKGVFANAFPRQFFEYVRRGTRRLTVTTLSCLSAGVELRTAEDLADDVAVSADLTRERWADLGYPELTPISARESGAHLARLSRDVDFTLFEYWLTDHAGHKLDFSFAVDVLERFDDFLGGILEHIDLKHQLLAIVSDHGNIEDLSTKTHTRNDVPIIVTGRRAGDLVQRVDNITHITPTIVDLLTD